MRGASRIFPAICLTLLWVPSSAQQLLSVNINFGGPNIDSTFVSESFDEVSGETWTFSNPEATVFGTDDVTRQALTSHRYGTSKGAAWGYNIRGLRPGIWECSLLFAEIHPENFRTGARLFYVSVNGEQRLLDVFAAAGPNTAHTEHFVGIHVMLTMTNTIAINFQAIQGDAFLSAASCNVVDCTDEFGVSMPCPVSQSSSSKTAVSLNLGGPQIGKYQALDNTVLTGNYQVRPPSAADSQVLSSHVFGKDWGFKLSYLAPGSWECTATFSENHPPNFSPSARLFNIAIGDNLRKSIDVYSMAGPFASHTETFSSINVTPMMNNEILIHLYAVKGDAFLSAIDCQRIGCINMEVWKRHEPCLSEPIVWPLPRPQFLDFRYINFGGPAFANLAVPENTDLIVGNSEVSSTDAQILMNIRTDWATPLLATHRYAPDSGSFSYTVEMLQTGIYSCQVHLAETYVENFEEGKRVFDIEVQGRVHEKIDVFANAGGNAAFVIDFFDIPVYYANNNSISLTLRGHPGMGDPFISAFICKRYSCINLDVQGKPTDSACWAVKNGDL